jgi:hypothetical protein
MKLRYLPIALLVCLLAVPSLVRATSYIQDATMYHQNYSIYPYSYVIEPFNSTHYQSVNASGWVYQSTNASQVWNFAGANTSANGGGTVFAKGIHQVSQQILGYDGVVYEGAGRGGTIVNLTTPGIALFNFPYGIYRSGLKNMRLVSTDATTDTKGITMDVIYSTFDNLAISNFTIGMEINKTGVADNFINKVQILNFASYGMLIHKMEDAFLSDINVGTGHTATACIRFDEGGAGVHWLGLHVWASVTCTYGIILGYDSTLYQYDAQWDNVEIEDDGLTTGLYINGTANRNQFNNLEIRGSSDNGTYVKGENNYFVNFKALSVANYGAVIKAKHVTFTGGWVRSCKVGIAFQGAYSHYNASSVSHIDFQGNDVYDILMNYTKYAMVSDCTFNSEDVAYSIYDDHGTANMYSNCYAYMRPILTLTPTNVQVHTSYNVTSWLT